MADGGAARLSALLAQPEEHIDLVGAVLQLAEIAQPDLDPAPTRQRLEDLTAGFRAWLGPATLADAGALGRYLGEVQGFRGNLEQYYDPTNSYLNVVLERRTGLPITLSVVYMEVGRGVGLQVLGIGFPAHFIVGIADGEQMRYLDPFRAGAELTRADLLRQLRQTYGRATALDARLLQPFNKRAIILRMLNNLKQAYLRQESLHLAYETNEYLLSLQSDRPELVRDRGVFLYQLSRWVPAKEALRTYLQQYPSGADAVAVRGLLGTVQTVLDTRN